LRHRSIGQVESGHFAPDFALKKRSNDQRRREPEAALPQKMVNITAPILTPILRDGFRAVNSAVFPRKRDSFYEDITVPESFHYYGGGRSQGRI
jgi:hypothetical protein